LSHKIAEVQEAITQEIEFADIISSERPKDLMELLKTSAREACDCDGESEEISMPRYFQQLQEKQEELFCKEFDGGLDSLMKSNLVLERQQETGKGDAHDYFLCVSIDDEDLLWDTAEIDW
jgi:hypothetical protein